MEQPSGRRLDEVTLLRSFEPVVRFTRGEKEWSLLGAPALLLMVNLRDALRR